MTWLWLVLAISFAALLFIAARGQRRRAGTYDIDRARSHAYKHPGQASG
jgi:hypothetical protein